MRRRRSEDGPGAEALDATLLLRLMLTGRQLGSGPKVQQQAAKIHARLTVVLGHATVLVPAGPDGEPLVSPGSQSANILRVFTDDEAFGAWEAGRPPEDPPVTPLVVGDQPALAPMMKEQAATALMLNPAGPGGVLVTAEDFGGRSAPLVRAPVDFDDHAWLDPGQRAPHRRALSEALDRLGAAVDGEDEAAFQMAADAATELAGGAFSDAISLGRILWMGPLRAERQQGATKHTTQLYLKAAIRWGAIGETARCLQGLLAAGRVAGTMVRAGGPEAGWAATVVAASLRDAVKLAGEDHPGVLALRAEATAVQP